MEGFLICLDTNYLIGALVARSKESEELVSWSRLGEPLITPALAWYEFLCGPVSSRHIAAIQAFLHEIVPFDRAQAIEAARLFNTTGRQRNLRVDAMIAGTAIVAGATLATNNRHDFNNFVPCGLKLA